MWLVARYKSTSLFSLKYGSATSSGAKTLLVPTPFALKMALLDAGIRLWGMEWVHEAVSWMKGLTTAFQGSRRVVINKTFVRLLRRSRDSITVVGADGEDITVKPFERTVGFREYAQMTGPFSVALEVSDIGEEQLLELRRLVPTISYLGKRGGFVQCLGLDERATLGGLNEGWSEPLEQAKKLQEDYIVLPLDDMGSKVTFDKLNVFSGSRLRIGNDRIIRMTLLPYRMERTSESFEVYERTD